MIEFKRDAKRKVVELKASGDLLELAAETCVIVESIAREIELHNEYDAFHYLQMVQVGLIKMKGEYIK